MLHPSFLLFSRPFSRILADNSALRPATLAASAATDMDVAEARPAMPNISGKCEEEK